MENGVIVYFPWIIFAFIFVDYFLFSFLDRNLFRSSRDEYKWIRRESRILNALVKDYQDAQASVNRINERANQVWDSERGAAGITLQLDETKRGWLTGAEEVANAAMTLVGKYESRMSRGDFRKWSGLFLINLLRMFQLSCEMKKAKKAISDHLENEKIYVREICEALELSSGKLRSLKDRPIDETTPQAISSGPYFRSGAPLVCTLKCLIDQKQNLVRGMGEQMRSIEMQMRLQHSFMKDLRGLRLESEIENAWAAEAQLLIVEREEATYNFFKKIQADQQTSYWPLSATRNWMAWRKLKVNIKQADSLLSDLLKAKETYGFEFIRREPSKISQLTTPQQSMDGTGVSSAVNRIRRLLDQRPAQEYAEVTAVCNQLEQTQNLLNDMNKSTEGARHTRKVCFEQLKNMAYEAEISSTALIHMGPYSPISSTSPSVLHSHSKFLSEIIRIEQAASVLQKCIQGYKIKMMEDLSSVVGLEEDIHALVSILTSTDDVAHQPMIVCIVGMRGLGKTTLAKEIYNHTSIVNHFDIRDWVALTPESNEISKVKEALETWQRRQEQDEACHLLVLDSLSSEEAWGFLRQSLEVVRINNTQNKILITTRYKKLASSVDPSIIHQLRLRTKEESWEYFIQMVSLPYKKTETQQTEEEETPEKKIEALAKKIVRRSGGLPIAILHLGYLLVGKNVTTAMLSRVLEHVTQGLNQTPWKETWEVNKEDFKSETILGKCLSSFEIIPFNFEIPARRVVALWVARGLIQSTDTNKTPEDVAHEYLSELINRNMIQVVERRLSGRVKTCRFPTALREIWLQRPRDSGSIRAWSLTTSQGGQLAYHFDDNDANHNHRIHGLRTTMPSFLHEERYPCSIMFFDTREGNQPGEDIGNFLHKGIKSGRFHGLLVLDLEGVFRPHLPKNIGELKQLTYLGLRWTNLDKIPPSIFELMNLQFLDMKYTYIRFLPVSVWKLTKLRHLYLNEQCRIKFMPKPSAMSMKNLQTLSGAFLDDDSPFKDGLDKLSNLRKLGLVFQLTDEKQMELATSILQLTQLRSLSLSSVNEKSEPRDLELKNLSCLEKLSIIYLFGKLKTPSITNMLPKSLTELILSASQLRDDPMPYLGSLPNLKSLSFLSNSYLGSEMVFSSPSFPQLLDLKLWNLSSLTRLTVKEGAMQNLREMEIRSCTNLMVSEGLAHLKTLLELKLTNMKESMEVTAQRRRRGLDSHCAAVAAG